MQLGRIMHGTQWRQTQSRVCRNCGAEFVCRKDRPNQYCNQVCGLEYRRKLKPQTTGYRKVWIPGHPRAHGQGLVLEHIVIAEKALGRPLPEGAEVHHVDRNPLNNAHTNLVICENKEYHQLLHIRQRALAAGGDPNTEKYCNKCKTAKPFNCFKRAKDVKTGIRSICIACDAVFQAAREARRHDPFYQTTSFME